jgi:hypothetical protein
MSSVIAVSLSVALFAFWLVVGFGPASAFNSRRSVLDNLLLAPAVGVSLSVLTILVVTRSGMPSLYSAVPIALGLLAVTSALLGYSRPRVPVREYAPFALLLLIALIMTGRPMFERGTGWLSFANDDMANYVLGADLLRRSGFASAPDLNLLTTGQDYSLYYWFTLVPGSARPGSELLLGWTSSLTGMSGHQVFMPMILSLHLTLISAAAALVWRVSRSTLAALAVSALLSVSALTSLGTLQQLIAQVTGLGVLIAAVVCIFEPTPEQQLQAAIRSGLLIGLLVAALLVIYPEVFPFLGAAAAAHFALRAIRTRALSSKPELAMAGAALAITALSLNTYIPSVVSFLAFQTSVGLRPIDLQSSIFPYFLLPSGLADLWGFQNIIELASDPWLSIGIVAGGILLVIAAAAATVLALRGNPAGVVAIVMLALSARLFAQQSGFGLFKLAMYIQPFLIASLAIAWLGSRPRPRIWRLVPVVVLAIAGLPGQNAYVERSRGAFGEVPNGFPLGISQEFQQTLQSVPPSSVLIDTNNIVLAKLQALYTQGRPTIYPSRDFFGYMIPPNIWFGDGNVHDNVAARYVPEQISMLDPQQPNLTDQFIVNTIGDASPSSDACDLLVSTTGHQSIFNTWRFEPTNNSDFETSPCNVVSNHLIFVHSALGLHYYQIVGSRHFEESPANISIYQLEPDPMLAGRTMSGIGRYLLFEVMNPSQALRLMVDVTATLKADGVNALPQAAAIGQSRVPLGLLGRGSARVFSPPLLPQRINGRDYLVLDMGADPQAFPERRSGLMNLFGRDVPIDRRRLVGFGRAISAVSDAEYAAIQPPSALTRFPDDLIRPDVEYSGIYEDGWISDAAFVRLTRPADSSVLVIRGLVPSIRDPKFQVQAEVQVDGQVVLNQDLPVGEFELRSAVPVKTTARIELRFSAAQSLPDPDNRPVAAQLHSLGFESPAASAAQDIVEPDSHMQLAGGGWYALEQADGDRFRWVDNDAELALQIPHESGGELTLDVEPGPGIGASRMRLHVVDTANGELGQFEMSGRETVRVQVPAGDAGRQVVVRLHIDGGGLTIPNDSRTLNFRAFKASWSPSVS